MTREELWELLALGFKPTSLVMMKLGLCWFERIEYKDDTAWIRVILLRWNSEVGGMRRFRTFRAQPATSQYKLLLHPFNGLFSRTTWVSRHQKGEPFWILLEQKMMGWQWHQLDRMQIICASLQTDNHASSSPLSFYMMPFLPPNQQCPSTGCSY